MATVYIELVETPPPTVDELSKARRDAEEELARVTREAAEVLDVAREKEKAAVADQVDETYFRAHLHVVAQARLYRREVLTGGWGITYCAGVAILIIGLLVAISAIGMTDYSYRTRTGMFLLGSMALVIGTGLALNAYFWLCRHYTPAVVAAVYFPWRCIGSC